MRRLNMIQNLCQSLLSPLFDEFVGIGSTFLFMFMKFMPSSSPSILILQSRSLLLLLLQFHLLQLSSASPTFCYYGIDVNTLGAFQNQSCIDGGIHLTNDLKVTDYSDQTSPTGVSGQSSESTANISSDSGHLCYVFRHIAKQALSSGVQKESVKVKYGCDFRGACLGKDQDKVIYNATVQGQIGKLYCCNKDNCNTNDKIPHPPSENRLCYSGPVNKSGILYAELTSCTHPDTICAKSVLYDKDKSIVSERLYCDETKRCQKQLSSGAYRSSTWAINKDNLTERLWCCEMQKCFKPQWPILHGTSDNRSTQMERTFIDHPITNPLEDKAENSLLVAGLISAIVLVSVLGGVGIVILINRNRDRRQDPNVIMQYERLTNSDVDASEAVTL